MADTNCSCGSACCADVPPGIVVATELTADQMAEAKAAWEALTAQGWTAQAFRDVLWINGVPADNDD